MNKIICTALVILALFPTQSIFAAQPDFTIQIPRRCMFGDFDAVMQDMQYSSSPRLIISIKNLNSGATYSQGIFKILERSVNYENKEELDVALGELEAFLDYTFKNGHDVVLDSKILKEDGLYAVTICKDSAGTATCFDKEAKDIAKILKVYENPPSNYKSPDHIYFYQVMARKNANFVFPSDAPRDDIIKDFEKRSASKLDDKVRKDVMTVKSLNMSRGTKGEVIVALPVYDPVKCGQQ